MATITRIDLYQNPGWVFVAKWAEGWTASTPPIERYSITDRTLEDLANALERTSGWTVRRWPGGARGFRGKPMPVRTREQIKRKRHELEDRRPPGVEVHALDLMFEW